MSYVSTEQETGIFSAAFRIVEVVGVLPWMLVSAGFPILARAARDDARRHAYATERLIVTGLIGGAYLGLMTALLSKLAIDVVAGPKFTESIPVLRIQAGAVFASSLVVASTHALISLARYREVLILSAAALTASVVMVLVLAPGMGAEGAAVANVVGEGVSATIGLVFLTRLQRGFRFPWATLAKVAIALAPAGALALIPGVPDIAIAAVATLVYGGALLVLRAIPQELLDAVPRLR
jgi:O-antigen/teichoic acid export membrane protein